MHERVFADVRPQIGHVLSGQGRGETIRRDLTAVPSEFRPACGRPGGHVTVRQVPVTVRHAMCDLSGVSLSVPGRGGATGTPAPTPAAKDPPPPPGSARSTAAQSAASYPTGHTRTPRRTPPPPGPAYSLNAAPNPKVESHRTLFAPLSAGPRQRPSPPPATTPVVRSEGPAGGPANRRQQQQHRCHLATTTDTPRQPSTRWICPGPSRARSSAVKSTRRLAQAPIIYSAPPTGTSLAQDQRADRRDWARGQADGS
jgi:hypothetical protein